jgi:hypothetical protein
MLTVNEVASRYGVSTAFLVQALGKIGAHQMEPDSPLSAATVARFEAAYGDRIRATRPTEPETVRSRFQPPPPIMRVAHAKITGRRDPETRRRHKALLDDPGMVHAIDPVGTWDGDPWRGKEAPGDVHFYDGVGGPFAACGMVKVRAVLGERFDPEDTDRALCPRCAELVAEGKGFRSPPGSFQPSWCDKYLRLKMDGRVVVEQCRGLRDLHSGPHRTLSGATWTTGPADYMPAPRSE